jgi:hypothetical protein
MPAAGVSDAEHSTLTEPEQFLILPTSLGRNHRRGVPLCGQPVSVAPVCHRNGNKSRWMSNFRVLGWHAYSPALPGQACRGKAYNTNPEVIFRPVLSRSNPRDCGASTDAAMWPPNNTRWFR